MISLSCSAIPTSTHRGGTARRHGRRAVRRHDAQLHGGAAQADALLLQVGQSQRGQHVARADAALAIHAGAASPARPRASVKLRQQRTQVDRRASVRTLDRPRRGGQQTLDPLGQAASARRGDRDLVARRFGPGPSALPSGRTSTARNDEPRPALRRQPPQQLLGGVASRPTPLPSLRRVPRFRPPGPRETSSAVSDETPGSSSAPARRGGTAAPGTASSRGARSAAGLPAWKNECVLVIEPSVRLSPPLPLPAGNLK